MNVFHSDNKVLYSLHKQIVAADLRKEGGECRLFKFSLEQTPALQSLEQTPALQTLKMSIGVARASKPPYVLWESGVTMCWIWKVTPAKVTAVFLFLG